MDWKLYNKYRQLQRLMHQHQNKQFIAPGEERLSDGLKGTQSAVNYPVS